MSNSLVNILKIKELRNKVLYTIGILILYRIGTQIPVPGIDFSALKLYLASQQGGGDPLMQYFNFFAGGAFDNMSIFALGIMPYITTTIIMQLLMIIMPSLKHMMEEADGRKKFTQMSRIGTLPVCLIQSFLVINFVGTLPENIVVMNPRIYFYILTILITTTGTMVLMWLGERITEKGISNGISLIIFAGIVARVPGAIKQLFDKVQRGELDIPIVLMIIIMFVFIIALVIYEQQGQRKIPVSYAKRIVGNKVYGGAPDTYLPLKINPSGVIPIIFANSVLIVPQTLASMFRNVEWLSKFGNAMQHGSIVYMIVYTLLIIFFAYFYTQVTLNPVEIAKRIRENGGTIRGVPINDVESYLT